jgi:phosphoserine phosphatase
MQNSANIDKDVPLVVDLDGTLIRTDLLHESVFALLKINVLYLFMLPVWLLGGKANLKQKIADRVELRYDLLPYQPEFLDYLRDEHEEGRPLILATASNDGFAQGVAAHLGLFREAFGSSSSENNSGSRKLNRIKAMLNNGSFIYAGNGSVDVPIWKEAAGAVVVNA